MKIHEYQAKALFKKYDIPVPAGGVAFDTAEILKAASALPGFPVVLKAQIHAGGRGKGGGGQLAGSMEEVEPLAKEMLGMTLVTHQTGPGGAACGENPGGAGAWALPGSCIWASFPIVRRPRSWSWPARPGEWTSRRLRPRRLKRSSRCSSTPWTGFGPSTVGRLPMAWICRRRP